MFNEMFKSIFKNLECTDAPSQFDLREEVRRIEKQQYTRSRSRSRDRDRRYPMRSRDGPPPPNRSYNRGPPVTTEYRPPPPGYDRR